ncbi:MAG: transcriptional regulator, LysR family [Hydrocarboniphaga sp.]|nr:transcriptional regulator, LysR family [Hydrocarboniphaga sp.]
MMDFRALRHFVALAEELHFGRAAQKLHMSQPPLSQSIKRLEQRLGVQLVERSSRSVSLTLSGATFAAEARQLLKQVEFVERLVKQTAAGEVDRLMVGFIGPALYRILPRTLELLRVRMPGVDVRLEEMAPDEQIKRLRYGQLNVAVISPTRMDLKGLSVRPVERNSTVLAIPADWPFANRTEVRLAELKDYPFVLTPFDRGPVSAAFVDACNKAGFTPKVVQEATLTNTRLALVAAGLGAALVTETARYRHYQGVRFLSAVDLCDDAFIWELSIVWEPRGASRALRTLIESFDKAVADLEALPAKGVLEPTLSPPRVSEKWHS